LEFGPQLFSAAETGSAAYRVQDFYDAFAPYLPILRPAAGKRLFLDCQLPKLDVKVRSTNPALRFKSLQPNRIPISKQIPSWTSKIHSSWTSPLDVKSHPYLILMMLSNWTGLTSSGSSRAIALKATHLAIERRAIEVGIVDALIAAARE